MFRWYEPPPKRHVEPSSWYTAFKQNVIDVQAYSLAYLITLLIVFIGSLYWNQRRNQKLKENFDAKIKKMGTLLETRRKEFEERIGKRMTQMQELEAQKKELEAQLVARTEAFEKQKRVLETELETQLETQKQETGESETMKSFMQNVIERHKKELAAQKKELDAQKAYHKIQEDSLRQLRHQLQKRIAEIGELKSKTDGLKSELKSGRGLFKAETDRFKVEIENIKSEKEMLKLERGTFKLERDELKEKINSIETEIFQKSVEGGAVIGAVMTDLRNLTEERDDLKNTVNKFHRMFDDLGYDCFREVTVRGHKYEISHVPDRNNRITITNW